MFISLGCTQTQEVVKTIWGSSTRALEDARQDGIRKLFACDYDKIFDAVLKMTKVHVSSKVVPYQLFLKDRKKGVIVVIGIPGSVDTTEVGIFFDYVDEATTMVEISSLSTHAKMTAADHVFSLLENQCAATP